MKKIHKVLFISVILMSFFSIFYQVKATNLVQEQEGLYQTDSDIWGQAKNFIDLGLKTQSTFDGNAVNVKFQELIDFLWGIGLLVIFICTVVLGIKYMLVLPAEKSRLKQATTPYVVGVIIIFGALTIWKFVIYILDGSL